MKKSDARSDSTDILRDAVDSSLNHLREQEAFLDEHAVEISTEEARQVREKNIHLKQSIHGLQEEIKYETNS